MAWTAEKQREYMRGWRERNREKMRAYFRRYASENKERIRKNFDRHRAKYNAAKRARQATAEAQAKRRAYDDAHRATIRAQRKDWVTKNPERAKAIEERRRIRRAPKKREKDRAYRQQNPERCKAIVARAKAKNPELYRQHSVKSVQARRARKRAAPVERVSLPRIEQRDRSLCHLCGKHVERRDRSFDHLIPVVRGGAHAEWNLVIAHLRCNKRRGTKRILPAETKAAAVAYIAALADSQETR
jgi:5-methylcytosine-specific restriction endonuclease McrA